MCRFALYLGPPIRLSQLVTEPANSIIHQSFDSRERAEPLNGDGFGVAWYVPDLRAEPAVFRSITPAWNNQNLHNLAPVSVSHCLLAHVRAATPGITVTQLNCHPFVRDRWAMMHNGSIGGFRQLHRRLRDTLSDDSYASIEGTTDSEHLLAVMSDLAETIEETDPLEQLGATLVAAIGRVESLRIESGIEEPSLFNVAVTDGEQAVVSRFVSDGSEAANSLYFATGRLRVRNGAAEITADPSGEPAAVVASEPLGDEEDWTRVPPNHLVLVRPDRSVELRPIT